MAAVTVDGGATPGWDELVVLAGRIIAVATKAHITLACAESCTGGMVAAALTSVPGSSAVLRGGIVSYDPAVKHRLLGVSRTIIDDPGVGVVSAACARAMAVGGARACDANLCVSTTGIAGPSGAEPGKPVGTVYVGLARRAPGRDPNDAHAWRHDFEGERKDVRLAATHAALVALCEEIMND